MNVFLLLLLESGFWGRILCCTATCRLAWASRVERQCPKQLFPTWESPPHVFNDTVLKTQPLQEQLLQQSFKADHCSLAGSLIRVSLGQGNMVRRLLSQLNFIAVAPPSRKVPSTPSSKGAPALGEGCPQQRFLLLTATPEHGFHITGKQAQLSPESIVPAQLILGE